LTTYFLDLSENEHFTPGELSPASGTAAMRYLERATDLALEGKIAAIVTAPISKERINEAGYMYAGHTDYFHKRVGGPEPTMCFYTPDYSVALVCDHVPLCDVNRYVTKDRVSETINRTNDFLKALGIAIPTLGVIGLNPHCGESGLLGDEEISEIIPAIRDASENGVNTIGPLTPEAAFQKATNKELNSIVAMYHDQGIAPLKSAGLDCINVSLGLPFVRTSVSHGTAADISGKGAADETSMQMALDLAVILTLYRQTTLITYER
ncbi:MAG: 4-hydroxythreonine-4-phosphate dehydrogenase PdxA, partial [bacterium]|nr:4-hydroxythreonine-4-phosphate dehydrogenase PdxA [bacterium]